ncbi:MAG: hypothetical protein V2J07_00305 [Anaerolineae bacterium]|jgi:hypothetical protein|nr:hypothetical protein [Anaerolineae bacterium]
MKNRYLQARKVHNVEYADVRIEDKFKSWVNFHGMDLDEFSQNDVATVILIFSL